MEFFNDIEVGQVLMVYCDVVRAPHLGNTVNREAGCLVERNAQIEKGQGNYHAVDDGCGKKILRANGKKPAENSHLELLMRLSDGLLEFDTLAFDFIAQTILMLMQRCPQFIFERSNLIEYETDFFLHGFLPHSCDIAFAAYDCQRTEI